MRLVNQLQLQTDFTLSQKSPPENHSSQTWLQFQSIPQGQPHLGPLVVDQLRQLWRQVAATNVVGLCSKSDSRHLSFLPKALSKFHMHPESMSVEEGSVARFQCLIQGVPEATITWEHNRTELSTEDYR